MPIFRTLEQLVLHIQLSELYEIKMLDFYHYAGAITDEDYLVKSNAIITKWHSLSKDQQDNWLDESRLKAL